MTLTSKLFTTAALLAASGVAPGHPGHEAIGDGLHVEYLFAAGAVVVAAVYGLVLYKRNRDE
ncbi:hypothetical protein SAMN05216203_1300 [Marinobacter daqiaonensis]|uniref:Uncharacterized protein n=1 Tax=Marinobacter daqiaonensis TaxID=650891 RepID=A0A1I6HJR5_9GAMM|nr:hypothetical protein [Marinobacter daqiaonensis]SFR54713.1 hypothetical protein SAMN05216203_1300 [Marinobacter daqiaonensis]